MGESYLQNFVQSVFDALKEEGVPIEGGTLCVSGDGRFYNSTACQIIIKMAAAAGVGRVWCGTDGLLSTPAMSAVIRTRARGLKGMAPFGGFILSASHNPGGIDEDFGIKYSGENGGPAPEKVTDLVFKKTTAISQYHICNGVPDVPLDKPGSFGFGTAEKPFNVQVFPCVEDHVGLLKQVFDFGAIKSLCARTRTPQRAAPPAVRAGGEERTHRGARAPSTRRVLSGAIPRRPQLRAQGLLVLLRLDARRAGAVRQGHLHR